MDAYHYCDRTLCDHYPVVYRDDDGNIITYSHGYLHFASDVDANLDPDNYRDLDLSPADTSPDSVGKAGARSRVQG